MTRVIVPKVFEFTVHPWTGSTLSITGSQYTSVTNTLANDANAVVNTMPIGFISTDYPAGGRGTLKEVELGLTAALLARTSTNSLMTYWWQARNAPPPDLEWVSLTGATVNIPGTSWTDVVVSGYGQIQTNFNKTPFQVRCIYQCNVTNEGSAKIKNSSYVRYIYEID